MDDSVRYDARKLLIRAKLYRLFALCFAGVGLLLFGLLYFNFTGGNFLVALSDPFIIGVIVGPFVPSGILSMMAQSSEKKLIKRLTKSGDIQKVGDVHERTELFSKDKL